MISLLDLIDLLNLTYLNSIDQFSQKMFLFDLISLINSIYFFNPIKGDVSDSELNAVGGKTCLTKIKYCKNVLRVLQSGLKGV